MRLIIHKRKLKAVSLRKLKPISIGDLFFYVGMLLQLFYTGRIITINSYENSSVYVFLILLCFSIAIVKSKLTKKEINILVLVIMISALHMLAVNDTNLLRLCLMCYAGRRVDSNALKKFFVMAYVGLFATVYYLSANGMIDSGLYQERVWRVTAGWETRYNLGFDGPNRMMFMWVCIMASSQLLFGSKNLIRDVVFMGISIYLYSISISRSGIVVSIVTIIMPYILSFCIKKLGPNYIKKILHGSLMFVLILTVAAVAVDLSNTALGITLNGRTGGVHRIIANGIYPSLFGTVIPESYKGLDNSYFYVAYVMGIIPTGIMIFVIWKLSDVAAEKHDLATSSVILSFILLSYVMQTLEYPYLNYFLFILMENWDGFVLKTREFEQTVRRKRGVQYDT